MGMITSLAMTSGWKCDDEFSLTCMESCYLGAVYNMKNITVKSFMKNTQPVLYELLQHMVVTFSDVSKRAQFKKFFTKTTYHWLQKMIQLFMGSLCVLQSLHSHEGYEAKLKKIDTLLAKLCFLIAILEQDPERKRCLIQNVIY